MTAPTKLEFDVEMTCGSCVDAIHNSLKDVPGVKSVEISLDKEQVLVETTLNVKTVTDLIENTGRRAVLKGMGGNNAGHLGAAVSILEHGSSVVKGLVRFVQTDQNTCVIDGTVDGLTPGQHASCVHELGDLSSGCQSCGNIFMQTGDSKAKGDLGNITAARDGRAEFRLTNDSLKVWDIIGRSILIHAVPSDIAHEKNKDDSRLVCGVIARSAGLFQNPKKICACDGVTQWDERNRPLAGKGRQAQL